MLPSFRDKSILPCVFLLACGAAIAAYGDRPLYGQGASAPAGGGASSAPQGEDDLKSELTRRILWTSSRFRGRPEPPPPLRASRIYPHLHFQNPTVLTSAPGTERLFVAEHNGKIYSLPPDRDCRQADLLLDVQDLVANVSRQRQEDLRLVAVYGLTFHPRFAENGYCYVCYVVRYGDRGRGQHPVGTRVVRLQVRSSDPPRADPGSEREIISWLEGGHNGGCLKFGPDGCLYISTGDGGFAFPPDGRNAGQDVSNLLSAVLRINVDHPDPERGYSIPADNPFVSLEGARGEIWAYGMRNPWKMSFDRETGELWVGDVGWELWELIYRVRKGDNFGWSLVEGRQPVHAEGRRGPTPIVPPAVEIPHTDGASVTGGFVYRGRRFPELVGTYVFGDWETRRIWGVQVGPTDAAAQDLGAQDLGAQGVGSQGVGAQGVGPRRELVEPTVRIVGFAEDHQGELYLLDYDDGTIHELVRNDSTGDDQPFPLRLSETGIFADVARHAPASGVLPFSINVPQWSDDASAERLLGVPGQATVRLHAEPQRVPGSMFRRSLEFPPDAVLVKTLSLEETRGEPSTRRRIETQVLHFDGRDWRGYSYQWNSEQTDATLVPAEGASRELRIQDPQAAGGQLRYEWRFASRTECMRCHNPWAEHALAFQVAQINRPRDDADGADNQLTMLRQLGILEDVLPDPEARKAAGKPPLTAPLTVDQLPRLVSPADAAADLDRRARAYLHVNCAHCHRDGGGGSAYMHLPYDTPLLETKSFGKRPTQGTFGIHDAEIIAAGDPFRSVLYYRMAKPGPGHMPHLGARRIDPRGVALIHDWIRQLPVRLEDQQLVDRLIALEPDEQPSAAEDKSQDTSRRQLLDQLLESPSRAMLLARAIRQEQVPPRTRQQVLQRAGELEELAIRDLFEPFLPDDQKIRRLGDRIDPAAILALPGDAGRGRALFHEAQSVQCRNCHRLAEQGHEVGPDLSRIGKKYDRSQLLDSLLDPSRTIDPKYITWLVESSSGKVYTGLLVQKDEREVILKDARNQQHRLPLEEVDGMYPQRKSLMPDLLLREMTAQQVADLLAYLASLK